MVMGYKQQQLYILNVISFSDAPSVFSLLSYMNTVILPLYILAS